MILKFLKELPDKYILLVCFFVVMAFYRFVGSDAILQLLINFAVAIIALSKRPAEATSQINADTVQTDSVNPGSMDGATINTDSINNPKGD